MGNTSSGSYLTVEDFIRLIEEPDQVKLKEWKAAHKRHLRSYRHRRSIDTFPPALVSYLRQNKANLGLDVVLKTAEVNTELTEKQHEQMQEDLFFDALDWVLSYDFTNFYGIWTVLYFFVLMYVRLLPWLP